MARAEERLNAGDVIGAFETLANAKAHYQEEPVLLRKKAAVCLMLDAYELAWIDNSDYLAVRPQDSDAWANQGRIALSLDDISMALDCYLRARELGSKVQPELDNVITRLTLHLERTKLQLEQVSQRLEAAEDGDALAIRAQIYLDLHQYDKAIADVNEWLNREPASILGRALLGVIFVEQGKADAALKQYDGLGAEGHDDRADVGRAYAHWKTRNWAMAKQQLERLITRHPDSKTLRRQRASVSLALGDIEGYKKDIAYVRGQ